jgi:hypothetical protein
LFVTYAKRNVCHKKRKITTNKPNGKKKEKKQKNKQKWKKTRKIMLLFHDKSSEMSNLILKHEK